jgi:hypothetical protein
MKSSPAAPEWWRRKQENGKMNEICALTSLTTLLANRGIYDLQMARSVV